MNLRTYTFDSGRRRKSRPGQSGFGRHWSLIRLLLLFFLPLVGLFAIFAFRVMLNSEREECQRRAAGLNRGLHETDREIQHLRNRIESLSRRQFIFRQVAKFELQLGNPSPWQMRNLEGRGGEEGPAGTEPPPRRLIISSR